MIYNQGMSEMPHTAKLFMDGRDQAVELPDEFGFEGDEVGIRKDPVTGDVILSRKTNTSSTTPTSADSLNQ